MRIPPSSWFLPSLLLLGALGVVGAPAARADDGASPPGNLPKPVSRRIQGTAPPGAWTGPAAPGAPAAAAVQRDVKGSGITEVTAAEDVALTGGGSAVEFRVRFRVEGDAGRHFYLNAVFLDPSSGQAVRSQRTAFADAGTGALYVISQPVVHAGGTALYDAVLQVPYDAVPTPSAGASAALEARISLFRRSLSGGMDESMDWASATFRVRGPAAAPVVAPPAPPVPGGGSLPLSGAPPAGALPPSTVGPSPVVVTAPVVPPTLPPEPVVTAPAAAATRILEIVKNHDQAYPDGRLRLRLDVRYAVAGDAGRSFYLHGLFFDQSTGRPVLSNRAAFADRTTGVLYVITQPGVHAGGTNEYRTSLWVPYDAFPRPAAGSVTPIEARLTLFRRDQGSGMDASMDIAATTFKIHGE